MTARSSRPNSMRSGKEGRLTPPIHHQLGIIIDLASTLIRETTIITSIKNLMIGSSSGETSRTLTATLYQKDALR